jgi:hypothetical protein
VSSRGASLALLLILAGCASAPMTGDERLSVEVEGSAPDGPGAAVRALADAQKRAVEKALGVALAASTRVEAAITVRRRIWADARGRVESWTVLGDKSADGLRIIRIRAVVRRLSAGEAVPPPLETTVRIEASGPAEVGLRRSFGTRGFTVVERGGDFVVKASGSSERLRDMRTAPFVTGRGRVSVSVVDAATGGVVWEQSREAADLDLDPLNASARAIESAGELGGRDAADGLASLLWRR